MGVTYCECNEGLFFDIKDRLCLDKMLCTDDILYLKGISEKSESQINEFVIGSGEQILRPQILNLEDVCPIHCDLLNVEDYPSISTSYNRLLGGFIFKSDDITLDGETAYMDVECVDDLSGSAIIF
jgi:hypothetical protein